MPCCEPASRAHAPRLPTLRRRAELDGYMRELLASRVLQAHAAVRETLELA